MEWTDIHPSWQLGVLDSRDGGNPAKPELASVLCSIILQGFVPTDLNEVGFRLPTGPVQTVSGAVRAWTDVPALLDRPEALATAAGAMKALFLNGSK